MVQLPRTPAFVDLVFAEAVNQYTFCDGNDVLLYDVDFLAAERFSPPQIIELRSGGTFPITRHKSCPYPHRTLISPNKKWLLLDYLTAIVLMECKGRKVRFCLTSQGGQLGRMGFLDSRHFWYTKGDTTYIQPIGT